MFSLYLRTSLYLNSSFTPHCDALTLEFVSFFWCSSTATSRAFTRSTASSLCTRVWIGWVSLLYVHSIQKKRANAAATSGNTISTLGCPMAIPQTKNPSTQAANRMPRRTAKRGSKALDCVIFFHGGLRLARATKTSFPAGGRAIPLVNGILQIWDVQDDVVRGCWICHPGADGAAWWQRCHGFPEDSQV